MLTKELSNSRWHRRNSNVVKCCFCRVNRHVLTLHDKWSLLKVTRCINNNKKILAEVEDGGHKRSRNLSSFYSPEGWFRGTHKWQKTSNSKIENRQNCTLKWEFVYKQSFRKWIYLVCISTFEVTGSLRILLPLVSSTQLRWCITLLYPFTPNWSEGIQ